MKFRSFVRQWALPIIAIASLITLAAWVGGPQQGDSSNFHYNKDTVPAKKKIKSSGKSFEKDLDKEIYEMERAERDWDDLTDAEKETVRREVKEALKSIDFEAIQRDVKNALKNIDFKGIEKEVAASLNKIDFDGIGKEVEKALREANIKGEIENAMREVKEELNKKEWRREMEQGLQKLNSIEVQKELDAARKELERAAEELKIDKQAMEKSMGDVKAEISKAKRSLKAYQEMIYRMEEEELLNTNGDYEIIYNEGELFINGKKQRAEVTEKYKKYFLEKRDKTTIRKQHGDFNIDID